MNKNNKAFWDKVAALPRKEILKIIRDQDPELFQQVKHVENVFATRLRHLTWANGKPITERKFTNEELAYLIDPPFRSDTELTRMGLSNEQQRSVHVASDRVLWAKFVLGAKPRLYQILVLRHPNNRKVLRWGRRLGKTYTMAIILLHYAYTTKNGRCLVMAPMKSQVKLIYEEIMKFVDESGAVKDSVIRNVTSPQYEIVLSNGSTIRFFTTGMKSGGKADVARGQEADMIVLDEMDYMGSEDLVALYAMLTKTDENKVAKTVVAASTPTGRREQFWNWCFPGQTLISTEDGSKSIVDIKVGDRVLDAYGGIDQVTETFCRSYEGDMVTINTRAFPELESTPGHPHLVRRDGAEKFVEASEIRVGDELKIPIRPKRPLEIPDFSDYTSSKYDVLPELLQSHSISEAAQKLNVTPRTVYKKLSQFRDTGYFCDLRRSNTVAGAETLFKLIINMDDLHALGLYVAEGHLMKERCGAVEYLKGICWTFASHEKEYVESCVRFATALGIKACTIIDKDTTDSTVQVIIYSSSLGLLFQRIFGEREHKRVPPFVDHATPEVQDTFIAGVNDGDGISGSSLSDSWAITLTAFSAIFDLFYMLRRRGANVVIRPIKQRENRRRAWILRFRSCTPDVDPVPYVAVTGVLSRKWSGTVYNFETKRTHTYTAEGFATHNCVESDRFQEFWFPSYASPLWDAETEEEMREQYSEMAYRHEIEADWGEDAEGVYPRRYIDAAFIDEEELEWEYRPEPQNPRSTYVIGVDWDKYGAGPNICVLEICHSDYDEYFFANKLRIAYREEIPRSEFVLTEALDRIKLLNKTFDPAFIYVDKGFGEMQIEFLHKYGMENPSTGLRKKVKGVSFSGTFEMRDPATKMLVKKDMKPFMVENLRSLLERNEIFFPGHDRELYLQLISYIVLRTTEAGRPVFEASGTQQDHAHDALILACLAYTQNFSEMHRVKLARISKAVSNEPFLPQKTEVQVSKGIESDEGKPRRRAMVPPRSRRKPALGITRKKF